MAHQQITETANVYQVPQPSGFYSIIQIFKPGVTAQLTAASAVGATSFTVSSTAGMAAGDPIIIDTENTSDYLTINTVSGTTVTTTAGATYAHVSGVNVFRPGALTKTAGTPNLLLDTEVDANTGTSRGAYQVAWRELQMGGLDQATFFLHKSYEDNTDIQFGNWIIFGIEGGILASDAAAGASSISVTNLFKNTNLTTNQDLLNLQSGDPIVISDGTNTEIFNVSAISGNGPWTITLAAAPGGTSTLLNSYSQASGTKICRLRYQGLIQSRGRTTDVKNQFQIKAVGMFSRYGQVCGNSSASQVDGASLLHDIVTSYASTLPEIIVDSGNLVASSIPVTVKEQDARISAIMADILKQEGSQVASQSNNGLTVTPTALSFPQGSTATQYARVNGGQAPYTASSSNTSVATVSLIGSDAVNTTTLSADANSGDSSFTVGTTTKTIGVTQTTSATGSLATGDVLLIDSGNTNAEFVTIATVSGSTITTTKPLAYAHTSGAAVAQYLSVKVSPVASGTATITITDAGSLSVTIAVSVSVAPQNTAATVYAVWVDELRQVHHGIVPTYGTPTKTIDITNTSNTNGDWVYTLDTSDMDGTNLMNAAIVRGGQDSTGNRLRILVMEKASRKMLNAWYEGTLDNSDISDEKQLANWAASQLAVLAYPMTSAQLNLSWASGRISTQDLLQINGFTDGSTMVANPLQIDYVADAEHQTISGTLTLGVLRPDVSKIVAEYANEKSIRETYNTPSTNLTEAFVINGFDFTDNGNLSFTIGAGTISYNGTVYAVEAFNGTAPLYCNSLWGVQVSGGTAYIVRMPYASTLTPTHAYNTYEINYRGGTPEPSSSFTGVPLWRVTTMFSITGWTSIMPSGGVGGNNLKPPTAGTPSVTLNTHSITAEGAASAYYSFSATVSSMTFDDTIASIDVSYAIAGSGNYHPWVPCVYQPSTGSVSGVVHGLAAEQSYDVALQPRGHNGQALGSPLLLGSSPTVSSSDITAVLNNSNLATMPGGATISVSSVTEGVYDGGIHTL